MSAAILTIASGVPRRVAYLPECGAPPSGSGAKTGVRGPLSGFGEPERDLEDQSVTIDSPAAATSSPGVSSGQALNSCPPVPGVGGRETVRHRMPFVHRGQLAEAADDGSR